MKASEFSNRHTALLYRTRHFSMTVAFVISLVMLIEGISFIYRITICESAETLRENGTAAALIAGFHILLAAVFA